MTRLRQGELSVPVGLILRGCFFLHCVALIINFPMPAVGRAADSAPDAQPVSPWIKPLSVEKIATDIQPDPSQDFRWLLSDRQINAKNDEEFMHQVGRAISSAGAQYGSHIMIDYDPTCESLTFHWARVWRGRAKLDRLDLSKLHLSQAEYDPGQLLFEARKTATLVLDDVRPGDIIDYAYSIEGSNPVLADKFTGEVDLQFSHPVDRAVTRLLWPSSRQLYLKNHLATDQPRTLRGTNLLEFVWDSRNTPALLLDPSTPRWYDPYPWVQLSEFQRWSDVSRWALKLFTNTNLPSADLTHQINEWKKIKDPADRVLAALRFVQEDVRYPAVADEAAGYQPAAPSTVFARRYGDCKDKTLLLVTMLRGLKIDAFPMLVNNRRRQELAELRPSPSVFNHAVAQVNLGGQSYWLDTTVTNERGTLSQRSWPDYGWGLLVSSNTTALTPIPPCPVPSRTTVWEYLEVGLLGHESAMKIVTVAEGLDADRLRGRFATALREEVERDNLNEFGKIYPHIRRTSPLLCVDDDQMDRIQTTETYAIEKIWAQLPDEQSYHCRIYPINMDQAIVKPAVSSRTMPLEVNYPEHQIFHAEVSVTTAWNLFSTNTIINDPAFYFQRSVKAVNNKVAVDYEYRALTDAVAAETTPIYARDLETATDTLGYNVIGLW